MSLHYTQSNYLSYKRMLKIPNLPNKSFYRDHQATKSTKITECFLEDVKIRSIFIGCQVNFISQELIFGKLFGIRTDNVSDKRTPFPLPRPLPRPLLLY